eukprot:CAMPEP_0117741268 /NCGR_PEP_ID=MMETSP0947-20121206/4811_1 /TAXON_ID=44440 /ORGANISM="Chattonella subsalsa, Strain CCMP2191" /LENGTH=522 /DNA_ID=CAMNT_0005557491 /DNA_START=85 /DNA_END=1650 /DNA_ORIENTATION=+
MDILCSHSMQKLIHFSDLTDILSFGSCCKYFFGEVSRSLLSINIEGKRLNQKKWLQLVDILTTRLLGTESITFRNCNVTTDIVEEIMDYEIRMHHANFSTSSKLICPADPPLQTNSCKKIRALAVTKCFQIGVNFLEDLPGIQHLESACYGNLSRCRIQCDLQYPNLRILGFTNYQIATQVDSTFFLADLAHTLTQPDVLPNLEMLFLGGLKGYSADPNQLPSAPPFVIEEPRAAFPPKLKVVELSFWKQSTIEAFKALLQGTCWGKKNGPMLPHIVCFDTTPIEELNVHFSFEGWSEEDMQVLGRPALRAATDCANDGMRRPLHLACMLGDKDRVGWLKEQGTDLDVIDGKGCTPILRAAEAGHFELVKLLNDSGVDLWRKNHNTEGLLYLAALKGHNQILQLILPHLQDHPQRFFLHDGDGFSPLHAACLRRSVSTADLLIRAGFDVNLRNKYQQTPLHLASRTGHLEMITLLMDHHADLEAKDEVQCTPATVAQKHNKPDAVQLLLSFGACPPKFAKSW